MRKVTVSMMREKYAQTVLTFRITYVNKMVLLIIGYMPFDINLTNITEIYSFQTHIIADRAKQQFSLTLT